MTAFATAGEFATRLGVNLTTDESADATSLLDLASDMIRDETGQTISLVTDDEITIPGMYGSRIRLPQRPLVSVSAVSLGGQAIDATGWYVAGDELVRAGIWPTAQNRFSISGAWGDPSQSVDVTYTHGYATIPGSIKAIALEMVARVWVNPGSVLSEVHGSEQVSYQRSSGLLLTDEERATLNSLLGRTMGSLVLR